MVGRFLDSVDKAEQKLGCPPSSNEIFVEMSNTYTMPISNGYESSAILFSLLREDRIFANEECSHFSTKRQEGFKSYSEIFKAKYPGYKLNYWQAVVPDSAKTVNFKDLFSLLKSKDAQQLKEKEWMFDGEFRFLDGEKFDQKIAFNTFPRSGNSMLRRLIEQLTGVTTGATVSLHTSTSLQCMGLKGEAIVDERVWVVKAHHPALMPGVLQFASNKVICCIRNPLDVIISFASLGNTMSHSVQPEFSYDKDYPEWWNWWIREQAVNH